MTSTHTDVQSYTILLTLLRENQSPSITCTFKIYFKRSLMASQEMDMTEHTARYSNKLVKRKKKLI